VLYSKRKINQLFHFSLSIPLVNESAVKFI
jgi:hypothetical protein